MVHRKSQKPSQRKTISNNPSPPPTSSSKLDDPRFASLSTDVKYRLPSRCLNSVKIDARFAPMLNDSDFAKKAKFTRYGSPINPDTTSQEQLALRKVYSLDSNLNSDDSNSDISPHPTQKKYDPARNAGFSTSESDDDDDDNDSSYQSNTDSSLEELLLDPHTPDCIPESEMTSRIAIVNLDWDNIRAVDIFAVVKSLLPNPNHLIKVAIYPSEFGKVRLRNEELQGPPHDIFQSSNSHPPTLIPSGRTHQLTTKEKSDYELEELDFNSTKLRKYQLQRLRYYYAIVTLKCVAAAKQLYQSLDGSEYMSSANFFDLRFVPDTEEFCDSEIRDACTEIPPTFKPRDFITDALRHSKVKLTWDEDDVTRKDAIKNAFTKKNSHNNLHNSDLLAYLGTSSSSSANSSDQDSDSANLKKSKKSAQILRAALNLDLHTDSNSGPSKPIGNLQVTFIPGYSNEIKSSTNSNDKSTTSELTTLEKYVEKEKSRKKRRKESSTSQLNLHNQPDSSATSCGFDDPFFTHPNSSRDRSRVSPRPAKPLRFSESTSPREPENSRLQNELELLMLPDIQPGKSLSRELLPLTKQTSRKRKSSSPTRDRRVSEASADIEDIIVDPCDTRFSVLFESPDFAIDPTHPTFRNTPTMQRLLAERRKRLSTEHLT